MDHGARADDAPSPPSALTPRNLARTCGSALVIATGMRDLVETIGCGHGPDLDGLEQRIEARISRHSHIPRMRPVARE